MARVATLTANCCRDESKPTHLDLFSGIGGFALAAKWAGFETVAFCESDTRCRAFLEKTWGIKVYPDIRTFNATTYRGVSLLTGGPPCQPASRAGKQGGQDDDRWLWDQALRVLEEAKPDCVVFENPIGIGDVGLDGILSEMGRIGYEVQVFDIPACAVDSPQLRHRFWVVGFACGERTERQREPGIVAGASGECGQDGCRPQRPQSLMANSRPIGSDSWRNPEPERCESTGSLASPNRLHTESLVNSAGTRQDREARQEQHFLGRTSLSPRPSDRERSDWSNSVWVPCADNKLRRAPDESVDVAHGLHRSLLGALGNSICPQVACEILKAIRGVGV